MPATGFSPRRHYPAALYNDVRNDANPLTELISTPLRHAADGSLSEQTVRRSVIPHDVQDDVKLQDVTRPTLDIKITNIPARNDVKLAAGL